MKKFLLSTLACGMLMLGIATPALAAGNDKIDSISNEYQLESNGTLKVKESITYTFGSEKHGLLRSFSEQAPFGASKFRLYQHGDFTVTDENGTALPYTKEPRGSFLDLKIGDPQKTTSGTHTYNLTYSVLNTVATSSDGTQGFSWNPTGTNWNVPIGNIKASFVGLPATLMPPKCSPATSCVITSSADRIDIAGAGQPFDVSFNFAANTFPAANAQFINNPNYGEPAKNSDASQSFLTPIVVGLLIVVVGAVVWGIIAINRNRDDVSTYSYSTPKTPTVVKYFSKAELSNIAAILTTKGHIYSKDPKGDVLYHKGDEYLNEVEKKVVDTGFAGSKSVTAKDFKKNLDSLFIERSNYTSYLDYINSQAETVSSQARSYDYSASSSNSSRSFIGRQTDYSSDVATQLLIASVLMNQYDSSSAYDNSSHSNTSSSSSDSSSYSSSSSSSSSSYDYGSSSSYSSYDSSSSYDSGSSSSSDGGGSW